MAVLVRWDDGTETRWDSATEWDQPGPRAPYDLLDDKQKVIATVPDFGVRYLALELPEAVPPKKRPDPRDPQT